MEVRGWPKQKLVRIKSSFYIPKMSDHEEEKPTDELNSKEDDDTSSELDETDSEYDDPEDFVDDVTDEGTG